MLVRGGVYLGIKCCILTDLESLLMAKQRELDLLTGCANTPFMVWAIGAKRDHIFQGVLILPQFHPLMAHCLVDALLTTQNMLLTGKVQAVLSLYMAALEAVSGQRSRTRLAALRRVRMVFLLKDYSRGRCPCSAEFTFFTFSRFSRFHVFTLFTFFTFFTFSRFSRFHRFNLSCPPLPIFPLRPIQNIARDQGLVPMLIFYLTTCACKSCCKSWRQLEPIYPHVTWPTGNMYVLYNICIYLYAYTYRKSSFVETYILTYIHTCIHTYIRTYIRPSVRTYIHTYIHIHAHVYTDVPRHTHRHTHKHTHTHRHTDRLTHSQPARQTDIHTYMQTEIHTCRQVGRQTDRPTDRPTDGRTDRLTDRSSCLSLCPLDERTCAYLSLHSCIHARMHAWTQGMQPHWQKKNILYGTAR